MADMAHGVIDTETPVNPYSLLEAVNASSETANRAWLIFLALMIYLMVAVAGVTHRDLLLELAGGGGGPGGVRLRLAADEGVLFHHLGADVLESHRCLKDGEPVARCQPFLSAIGDRQHPGRLAFAPRATAIAPISKKSEPSAIRLPSSINCSAASGLPGLRA